jgi:hypothetical protein
MLAPRVSTQIAYSEVLPVMNNRLRALLRLTTRFEFRLLLDRQITA